MAGDSLTDATASLATVAVIVALFPSTDAVMVAVPSATAVTTPPTLIETIAGLDDAKVTVRLLMVDPSVA